MNSVSDVTKANEDSMNALLKSEVEGQQLQQVEQLDFENDLTIN